MHYCSHNAKNVDGSINHTRLQRRSAGDWRLVTMHRKYFHTICIFDNLGVLVEEKQLKNEPRCIHEGYAASNTFTPAEKEQAYK